MQTAIYSCGILMKLEFFRHVFEKRSSTIFHEDLSSGSPAVPCVQPDGRTDMTTPIVTFSSFSKAPENGGNTDKCSCAPVCSVTALQRAGFTELCGRV